MYALPNAGHSVVSFLFTLILSASIMLAAVCVADQSQRTSASRAKLKVTKNLQAQQKLLAGYQLLQQQAKNSQLDEVQARKALNVLLIDFHQDIALIKKKKRLDLQQSWHQRDLAENFFSN